MATRVMRNKFFSWLFLLRKIENVWIEKNVERTYLRQFHLHVGENMQEAHHCVPQPAVSQTLLVPNTRALKTAMQAPSDSPQLSTWILTRL